MGTARVQTENNKLPVVVGGSDSAGAATGRGVGGGADSTGAVPGAGVAASAEWASTTIPRKGVTICGGDVAWKGVLAGATLRAGGACVVDISITAELS